MNKKINFIFYLFLTFSLASCSEDGEPGPQGEQGLQGEQGPKGEPGEDASNYIELGTINVEFDGTLLNGQPINGTKTFTTSYSKSGFKPKGDFHTLELSCSDTLSSINFDLSVFNRDNNPSANLDYLYINYAELINDNEMNTFSVSTTQNLEEVEYRMARNDETYGFINGAVHYEHQYNASTGNAYFIFEIEDGSKVKFENPYMNYNPTDSYYFGTFVSHIDTNGNEITSGTIYDDLELRSSPFESFYKDGTQLGELVTVLPDELSVTNFIYNQADGIVSFDFDVAINGGRRSNFRNSTRNDMTLSGSVEMEVYHQVNTRKGN